MTFRESDGCIVLPKPEDQSGGQKLGNSRVGKAAKPTHDRDWALSVLRDGTTMLTRLFRITSVSDKCWLYSPEGPRRGKLVRISFLWSSVNPNVIHLWIPAIFLPCPCWWC